MSLIDGQVKFDGASLETFWGRLAGQAAVAARHGRVPALGEVDRDAVAALALVDHGRLLARCPDCPGGVEYVWRRGPHLFFCAACLNRSLGGRWRLVVVPERLDEIERLLLLRPDPALRNWRVGEPVEALADENERPEVVPR